VKKKKKKKKSVTDRRGVSVLLLPSFLSHRISKGYMPLRRRSNPRSLSPLSMLSSHAYGSFSLETPETLDV
jgi:hypothetical protein